ncbi:MAG: sigma-70 family RNA polymerase sigma factor, partial [Acidimicrobiia bacterium]|nr:sigma-70 family RNA polymerase sigma factor [Acidimicrobiia bacterium]
RAEEMPMLTEATREEAFTAFAREVEPRIRHALIPICGVEGAKDATADALLYGWQHWERLSGMDNPAGYLYRVGRTTASRARRRKAGFPSVPNPQLPWVEPGLPAALGRLSPKQRTVVWLVHGLGWPQVEVADLLGLSPPTVQTHARRGMAKLRAHLGGTS